MSERVKRFHVQAAAAFPIEHPTGTFVRYHDISDALAVAAAVKEFSDGRRFKSPSVRQICDAIRDRAAAILREESP